MSDIVYLFSVTEQRVKYTFDDWIWDNQYSEQMVFDSIAQLRRYIYEWYEIKEASLSSVRKEGRVEMSMTHHLDLQARTQNSGRSNMLPVIIITFFTSAGAPRKRYMVAQSNAQKIRQS